MENLTHSLAGAVLARAGLDRHTPFAVPALVVASNLPDVDIFGSVFGLDYLDVHRGITHSVIGITLLAFVWTGIVWLAARARGRAPARFVPLLGAVAMAILSHPLLDFLNDYGVRPWLPWSARKYYGDLVPIVDPFVWLILGGGLALLARSRGAWLAWGLLGAGLVAIVTAFAGPWFLLIWLVGSAAVLLVGRALARRGYNVAACSVALFLAYLAALGVERSEARRRVAAVRIPSPVLRRDVLPLPANGPWRWRCVFETPDRFAIARAGFAGRQRGDSSLEWFDKNLDEPCYGAALRDPHMAAMARFARYPSVDVHRSGAACTVYLRDLRYVRESRPGWGVAIVTLRE